MFNNITELYILILLLPLFGSLIAGLSGDRITNVGAHGITIMSVGVSWLLSLIVAKNIMLEDYTPYSTYFYSWANGGDVFPFDFGIGIMVDALSSLMLVLVSFISLLVHIYSIGYMKDDPGYKRFFSYISFFTFSMYLLVMSNNFLQLFIGWEGVGVASYLLIGFWFQKESALAGSMKAFLVNRVSDFAFLLGIAVIFSIVGSLDYLLVFASSAKIATTVTSFGWFGDASSITVICVLLFWGAMGKSAQVPLHIWLPESMEGPTPISALIHAATMVTAGVFMIVRMSPLFELSDFALILILIIGATGALFTGILAIVMNDIKRVIAYSTLSQLGYIMVALGVSAYSLGIFHLVTHSCFKALLFLGAGSVILAMHHEQDMRKMGGLYKYLPITYATFFIGSLALIAMPPFAGFYSKELIIEAAGQSTLFGATYAYYCVMLGAFVTAIYTFRAFFMTFHGKENMLENTTIHIKESPPSIYIPLIILAILSLIAGVVLIDPMLITDPILQKTVFLLPKHNAMQSVISNYHGPWLMILHAFTSIIFWLTLFGILIAYICYIKMPHIPEIVVSKIGIVHRILQNKYGLDILVDNFFVAGSKKIGGIFYKFIDQLIIDKVMIDGSASNVSRASKVVRLVQTGLLNHYVSYMIIGTLILMIYFMVR